MCRHTFTIDIDVLFRMKSREEYHDKSPQELIRLIRIGMSILAEDERLLHEQDMEDPPYHRPHQQQEALAAAALYNELKANT